MHTTRFIYQRAVYLLALASLLSFVTFGAALHMRLSAGQGGYLPLEWAHAVTSVLWLLLLPAQAWLIRAKRLEAHRAMGRASFILAPLLLISIVWIAHDVLAYDGITDGSVFILAVRAFLVIYFAAFYLLAIRALPSRPDVHARWMICSAMVLIDPALSRLSACTPCPLPRGSTSGSPSRRWMRSSCGWPFWTCARAAVMSSYRHCWPCW
jgi:hypothetical protein